MINLGDKVKDIVSGYTGIAVCRTSYLEGCDRIAIQAKVGKDGKKRNSLEEVHESSYVPAEQSEGLYDSALSRNKHSTDSMADADIPF